MGDLIEYGDRKFESASVHDVDAGDFVKVRGRLVEIARKSYAKDPETGHVKSWTIEGTDGRSYGMLDIWLYLKPVKES